MYVYCGEWGEESLLMLMHTQVVNVQETIREQNIICGVM